MRCPDIRYQRCFHCGDERTERMKPVQWPFLQIHFLYEQGCGTCRIGRTGRAGRKGTAITFFVEEDAPRLQAIADCMRRAGCKVPEWMLLLKRGRAPEVPGAISERAAFEKRQRKQLRQIVKQSKVCLQAEMAAFARPQSTKFQTTVRSCMKQQYSNAPRCSRFQG
jgi:superfamily II DNA/RNA helicase